MTLYARFMNKRLLCCWKGLMEINPFSMFYFNAKTSTKKNGNLWFWAMEMRGKNDKFTLNFWVRSSFDVARAAVIRNMKMNRALLPSRTLYICSKLLISHFFSFVFRWNERKKRQREERKFNETFSLIYHFRQRSLKYRHNPATNSSGWNIKSFTQLKYHNCFTIHKSPPELCL